MPFKLLAYRISKEAQYLIIIPFVLFLCTSLFGSNNFDDWDGYVNCGIYFIFLIIKFIYKTKIKSGKEEREGKNI